ncbi:MAG: PepSY-associated TM helix domain-containing protein [Pseudomonadota bacterium]
MTRKIIKKIHLWLTLIFFIPLVIQGLSGTVMVFESEIEDLISGHKEYKLPNNYENQNSPEIDKIIATAQNVVPKNYSPNFAQFLENQPAKISFAAEKNPKISVFVDPFTLEILGRETSNPNAVLKTIHQLHTNLLIAGKTGRNLIGYVGIVMFLMLISGIIIWFPKQISRLKEGFSFKFSDSGFNFHRRLHKSVGIWSYLVFFIVTFSGIYIVFPQYIEPIFIEGRMREKITLPRQEGRVADVNEVIKITRNVFPDEKIISIFISNTSDRPYRVNLKPNNYITGGPMINVNIDPIKAEIIKVQNPDKFTIGATIMAWQAPLHFGEVFGLPWRIALLLCGFLPLLFTITGISMWWKKRKSQKLRIAK